MSTAKYSKQDPETIQKMFSGIAENYDKGNAYLSFNLHRYWNRRLVKEVMRNPMAPLLDLCAGTGDIASLYLLAAQNKGYPVEATLLDFCKEMLFIAEKKLGLAHPKLNYVHGDAQKLPFEEGTFGTATVAYGIRNVAKPSLCFQEVFRVLKPGGTFGILELTRPSNPLVKPFHTLYLKTLVPVIGKMVAKDKEAYSYLQESIKRFVSPALLCEDLKKAGFETIRTIPLTFGTATVICAQKPS